MTETLRGMHTPHRGRQVPSHFYKGFNMKTERPLSLNRTVLKYIALAAMLCDHYAFFMVPRQTLLYSILRCFGRFTAPIMCMFLAEGFIHTSSHKKYALRLGVFALITQIPWTLALNGTLHTRRLFTDWNMIYTLFLSYLFLYVCRYVNDLRIRPLLLAGLFSLTYFGDWGLYAPIFVYIFYRFRDDSRKKSFFYTAVAAISVIDSVSTPLGNGYPLRLCLWTSGVFLVIPLLLSYNGKKGSSHPFHKWIFYVVYAAQFYVFYYLRFRV